MKHQILIEPSILAADFGCLAKEAKRIADAGADAIHFDIMDGHFVPNLSLSAKSLAAVNRATDIFLDVHIMIYNPFNYVEQLVESGADRITFHFEATEDVEETLEYIRKCGVEAGLAFRPETSASFVPKFLDKCDLMLFMTVNPGFGGQAFLPEVLEKVGLARQMCCEVDKQRRKEGRGAFHIQVDGGIDDKTAALSIQAGANVLVSGTYLLDPAADMKNRIVQLRGA